MITFPITSKFAKNSPSATHHLFNSLLHVGVWSNTVFHVLYIATQNFCYCIEETYLTCVVALPKVVVPQWKHLLEKYRKGKGTFHSSFVREMELTCQEHNPSVEIVKTKVFDSKYVKDPIFELQRKIWRHHWLIIAVQHNYSSCEIKAWKNSGLIRIQTHHDLCDTQRCFSVCVTYTILQCEM